jgi:cation diffusion facilitator family transporter
MKRALENRLLHLRESRLVFCRVLGLNVLVALSKLVWGFMTGTLAMVAEGFHSLLDVSSNVAGIIGVSLAFTPPDADHPYGHRKFEALAAIAISFFMFLAAFNVLSEALHRLGNPPHPVVKPLSYAIMILTLAVNVFVARYEQRKSRELSSELLMADASHTFSDVYASATVIATLIAIQLNFPIIDTIASLVIVGIIFHAGYGIIMAHLGTLVDQAILDPSMVEALVLQVPGVSNCHKIRSRGIRDHIFLDLHVQVPQHISVQEAHEISFAVEEKLRGISDGMVDVLVHIEDDAPPPIAPPVQH